MQWKNYLYTMHKKCRIFKNFRVYTIFYNLLLIIFFAKKNYTARISPRQININFYA